VGSRWWKDQHTIAGNGVALEERTLRGLEGGDLLERELGRELGSLVIDSDLEGRGLDLETSEVSGDLGLPHAVVVGVREDLLLPLNGSRNRTAEDQYK
jgi:hypothetical protein